MSHRCEPRRIAPGTRTDVENATRLSRNQMQHRTVRVGGRHAFIAPEQFLGLVGITFGAAHRYRHKATSPQRFSSLRGAKRRRSRSDHMPLWIASLALAMTISTLLLGRQRAAAPAQADILQLGQSTHRNRL